ncbi:DNA repair and recombination protein RadB [Candidatus Woesearchaeota archaeon CG10_big_fil_rev_8_21_14_0_10_44_13]|nr:MAG: DNA repair and recombination protein RadB [Candidatus Woesearchaeota archaeon CG10_big_fil_rev_8_21_14_0_10_44_13]
MGAKRIPTGISVLDNVLRGGYEPDVITTLYGPAGSGKTNFCIMCMIETVKRNKKVIYIDTEGGFSVERLMQVYNDYKTVLDSTLFFKPTSFEDQKKVFDKLKSIVTDKIGLIIVDSISMLYRLEMGKTEEVYHTNRELGLHLSILTDITRNRNIPVLLTNQVYSVFDERDKVNMVGGDIIRYGSKCLIELQKAHMNKRKIFIRKHRSLPESEGHLFEIREEGISEVQ